MILALDLATNTGLCAGTGEHLPVLAHVRLKPTGDDVGAFLCEAEDWIKEQVESTGATLIVYESPLLQGEATITTRRKLFGLAGVTEMVAHREGIECAELTATAVKKALTGSGRAEKHHMVEACRAYGLEPHTYTKDGKPASDEADAFGIWIAAVRLRFPKLADRWAPRGPLFQQGRAA